MKTRLIIFLLALAAVALNAQPQPGIDKFLPTLGQLGAGWVSNTVMLLVDPLSSPREVANGGWHLELARKFVGEPGHEAYAAVRYVYGTNNAWIYAWINRYRSKEAIPPNWGTDKNTKMKLESLPEVGDEVRFYQRDGLHDDFAFRRGNYLICVEGVSAPIDKLIQLTEVLDANLVKAQKEAASCSSKSKPQR